MNAEQNSDRSLIVDILADWRRMNVAGRIVISTTGGPLRTIITGTKTKPTGVLNSVKTGYAQPYESQAELRFMKICEADWHVVDWLAQPHRIEVVHDGQRLTYFPDFIVERTSGDIEILEIKRNKAHEVRKCVELKLGLAEEFYRAIKFRFRILDLTDLSIEPRFSNAEDIQRDAYTKVTKEELFILLEWFHRSGKHSLPFGEVVEFLGGGFIGRKKLHSMIVRRHLGVDISRVLDADTPVFRKLPIENQPKE